MTEQANKLSLAEEEELLAAKSERIRRRFKSSFIYLIIYFISFFMEGFKLKIKKKYFSSSPVVAFDWFRNETLLVFDQEEHLSGYVWWA